MATAVPGVAVVLPAYRDARQLTDTVEDFLSTLENTGHPHSVILVEDGSPDGTGSVAERLGRRYPGRVEVVRHESRSGYGAATRSGIAAALARTDHQTILLTDARGRFRAAELPALLAQADGERADVVLGYRRGWRRGGGIGLMPTLLARLLLRPRARDVGCAYKLIDRGLLEGMELTADSAAVGPELIVRARRGGARIVERPVTTLPPADRDAAEPSWRARASLREIVRVWARERAVGARRRDPVLALLTAASAIGSALAFLYFLAANAVLAYPDAVAHLLIARRVIESPTPGAAQLGAVWLPLPHVLALPVVGVDALYVNGLAAAVVSMAAFVLTVRYLYKLVHELTGCRPPAVVAAAVFALCPNVLYLQSTPMSELPFICGIAGATYHLTRWTRTGRHMHLALAAALTLLATMTRYEAWVFALTLVGVVVVTAWRRTGGDRWTERLQHVEANVIYFGVIAFAAVAAWFGWNAVIIGDATYFYDGQFSEVPLLNVDIAAGSWGTTLLTYWYAVADNIGFPLTVVGGVAIVVYLVRTRLRGMYLAAAAPLVLLPFFLYFVYSGGRPLRVLEISGVRYNVRFGLIMIVPIAIAIGYLVAELGRLLRDRRGWATGGVAAVLVGVAAFGTAQGGIAALEEGAAFRQLPWEQANARAAAWLRSGYGGGRILMDTPANETVVVDARLPTRDIVYDGSFTLWESALAAPAANGIGWIYMRGNTGGQGSVGGAGDEPDRVWTALRDSPELAEFELVYNADDRRVYRLTSSS